MRESNIDLLYQEFPFLSNLQPRKKVGVASLKRWDPNFLGKGHWKWFSADDAFAQAIYLLNEKGEVITRVGQRFWWWPFVSKDESVNLALIRLADVANLVKLAVTVDEHGAVEVWKLPKGIDNAHDFRTSYLKQA